MECSTEVSGSGKSWRVLAGRLGVIAPVVGRDGAEDRATFPIMCVGERPRGGLCESPQRKGEAGRPELLFVSVGGQLVCLPFSYLCYLSTGLLVRDKRHPQVPSLAVLQLIRYLQAARRTGQLIWQGTCQLHERTCFMTAETARPGRSYRSMTGQRRSPLAISRLC